MKLHTSKAWLIKRFQVEHKSIEEMSKEAGVTKMTIRRALEAAGLIRKTK